MSKLSMFIGGSVFECEGSEPFIISEREKFMSDLFSPCDDGDAAPEVAEALPFRVTRKTVCDDLQTVLGGELTLTVGDALTVHLLDGKDVDFVVTDEDDEALRLESRDCLGDYVHRNKVDACFEQFYTTLPAALQDAIIPTERKYLDKAGKRCTEIRKLFLPSAAEIFPLDECLGDKGLYEQMDWYKSCHNRIRAKENGGGTSDWYWTASQYAGSTTSWCSVHYNGYAYYNASGNAVGAPVCFRITKSK